MKKIFVAAALFLFAFAAACFAKEATIGYEELRDDVQLIDTRSEDLYLGWKNAKGVSGHLKGAIDFPAQWLNYEPSKDKIDVELKRRKIDKSKKTVLYADDELSEAVYDKFKEQGFSNLYALKGGINAHPNDLERLKGYERYVSPQWLQDLLDGKKVEAYDGRGYVIVEISVPGEKGEYESGHIKGAINLFSDDINHVVGPRIMQEYENIPLEEQLKFWGLPSKEHIKEVLQNAGINENTIAILYATTKGTTGANRAALVMDYAGVKNIKFLNGGKTLWKLEKRPFKTGIVTPQKREFGVQIPQNPGIVFSYEQERELVGDKNAVIASVRSFDEYLGKKSGYTYIDKAGDIANSRFAYAGSNPYAMEDFRNLDNTMFNYKIIEDRWKLWGISPDKIVSFHCGTGWRAAETYYIAKALGWPRVGVYVGGWYEWSKKAGSPVKEKGLPKDAPEKAPQEFFN